MLTAIDQAREKKRQENLNHIFEESKHKSGPDLDEAINNADQEQGSQAYEDNKEKVKEMKEKRATENPEEYRQATQNRVKEQMQKAGISEQELDNQEVQVALTKLNSSEIKEPAALVEAEMTAIAEVAKAGVTKQLNQLITKVEQALKTGAKEDIKAVKTQLLEFINSPNVHYQAVYHNREAEIKALLSKLENYSTSPNPTTNNKFPYKVVLPIMAILFLSGLGLLLIIRQQRLKIKLKSFRKKNKKS